MMVPESIHNKTVQQLPFHISQLNSQSHKLQHDIIQSLEDNIQICLDNQNQKKLLKQQIIEANKQYYQLERLGKHLQKALIIYDHKPKQINLDYEDKIQTAIRNLNYEDIIKYLPLLNEEQKTKYSYIAASLIGIPNKQNKKTIQQLLELIGSLEISVKDKSNILEQCTKVLIQRCFKMYFEQKKFTTNKQAPTYYSDIIQLYQKSFNYTFRLIQQFQHPDYYQAFIANQIFENLQNNVLLVLKSQQLRERALHVVINFKDSKENNLLQKQTSNFCKGELQQQLKNEITMKTKLQILRDALLNSDHQIFKIGQFNYDQLLSENKQYQNETNLLNQYFVQ
ncbi:hypothetical protein pb186bvf_002896 [Paramecium bursaria]